MRLAVIAAAVAAAAVSVSSLAIADDKGAPQPGKPIATAGVVDKLDVWHDDFGNFYVSPKAGAFASTDETEKWVFFGDKKGMYLQTVIGSSSGNGGSEWNLWSPRVKNMQTADLALAPTGATITCEFKDSKYVKRPLTLLDAAAAKAFVQRTTFYPRLWQRSAHFLARDDDGMYFFVDRWNDEHGGQGYRIFAGMKGQMKELVMVNVVSDSAGEIFATKGGDLKVVTKTQSANNGRTDPLTQEQAEEFHAYWKKGDKKNELTVLPLAPNRYLMYRDLGIYGHLGVVCDNN
jgi:hypothetical protein